MSSVLSSSTSTTSSTHSSTTSKNEKQSTKFKGIDINTIYKGSNASPPKANTTTRQHGLQVLGKVQSVRRMPPPANLPSIKSLTSSSSTSQQQQQQQSKEGSNIVTSTVSSNIQSTNNINNSLSTLSGWKEEKQMTPPSMMSMMMTNNSFPGSSVTSPASASSVAGQASMMMMTTTMTSVQKSSQQQLVGNASLHRQTSEIGTSGMMMSSHPGHMTAGEAGVLWSDITSGGRRHYLDHKSFSLQEDFPELTAEGKVATTATSLAMAGQSGVKRTGAEPREKSSGLGPSLKPQNLASWRDGGGKVVGPSQTPQSRSPSPQAVDPNKKQHEQSADYTGHPPVLTMPQQPLGVGRMQHNYPPPPPFMGPCRGTDGGVMMHPPGPHPYPPHHPSRHVMPPVPYPYRPGFHPPPTSSGYPNFIPPPPPMRGRGPPGAFRPPPPPFMAPHHDFNYPPGPYPHPHHHQMSDRMEEPSKRIPSLKTSVVKEKDLELFDRLKISEDKVWARGNVNVDYSEKLVFSDDEDNGKTFQKSNDNPQQQQQHPKFGTAATSKTLTSSKTGGGSSGHLERDWKSEEPLKLGVSTASTVPGQSPMLLEHSKSCEPSQYAGRKDGICSSSSNTAVGGGSGSGSSGGEVNRMPAPPLRQSNIMPEAATTTGGYYHGGGGGAGNRQPHNNEYYEQKQWSSDQHGLPTQQHPRMPHHPRDQPQSQFASQHHQLQQLLQQPQHYSRRPPPPPGLSSSSNTAAPANYSTIDDNNPKPYRTSSSSNNNVSDDCRYNIANKTSNLYGGRGDYDYEEDDDMEVSLRRTKDDDNVDPDRWKSGNYRQKPRRLDDVDVHSVEVRGNYDGACVEKEPNNKLLFNNNSNNKSSVSSTDLTSTQQQYQQQQLQQLKSSSINSSLHMADNANNNDSNTRIINKSISQHAISQLDKDYPHHQLHQPRMMPQHQQQYTQGQKYMPPQQQQQQQQQRRPDSNPCLIPQQTTTTPTTPSNFLDTPPVRMPQPSSPLTSNSSFGGLWGPSYDHRWSNMPSQQQPRPPLMPPPLQPQLPQLPQEQHGSGGGAAVVSAANEGCNKTAPTSKSHLEHSGSLESMYPVVVHKKPLLGQAPPPTRYYYPPYPPQPAYMPGGYHGGGRGAPGRGAAAVKTPATMMRDSEIVSSPGLSKNRRTVHDDVIVGDADDNNTGRDNGNIKDGDEDDDGGDVMDLRRRRNHAGGAHSRRNNFNDASEDGNEGCSPRDDYHHHQLQQQPQLSRQMSGGSRPTFQQQPEERKIIIHRKKSESERSDTSKNEPAARDVRERDATSSSVVTSNLQSATERIMSRNHEKGFRSQQQPRLQTYDERSSDCIRYDDNLDDDNDYYVGGEEHADEYYYNRRRKDVAREVKGHSHDEYNDGEGDDCDRRIVKNGRQLYDYKNVAAAGPGTSSQQLQQGRLDHSKRSNMRGGDARNYGHNRDGAEEYARRKFYDDDICKKYVDAKNVAPHHHHPQEDDNDGDKNDDDRDFYGDRDKRDSEEKQQTQQQHSARADNNNSTDRHQPTYQTTRQQQQHARQQQCQQHSRQQQMQQQQNSRSSHPPPISLDQAHENKHDESHFTSLKKQRPATTNISASTTTNITTTTAATSTSANNPTTNNIATGSNCSSGNVVVVVGKSDISSQKEVSARQDNFNPKLNDECGKISEETNKMRSNINVDSSAHNNIKDASTSASRTDSSYNKKKPSANFDVSRRREPETVKQYKKEHCDYDYSDDYYYSNYEDDRDQRYDYYNSKSYPGGSRKWNKPSAGRTDEGQRKDTYNSTSNFPGGGGSSGNNSNSTAYVNSRRGDESNCPEKVENYKEKFLPKENDDKMDDGNKSREASKSDAGAVGNEGPAGSMDSRSYHTKYRPSKPLYQCSYEEEREDDDRKYSHDTGSKASGRFYVPPKSKGSSYCHAGDRDECDADSFGGVAGRGGSRNYTGDLHDEKAGGKKFANDDDGGGGSSSRSSVEKQHQQQQQRDPVDANRGGSFRSKQQYQPQQTHQTNKPLRMPGNEKKTFDGNASSRNKMTKDARGAEMPASQQHLSDNTASKSGGNVVGKKFDNDSNHINSTATPSDGKAKNFPEKNSSNKSFDECSSFTKDTNKSSAVLEKNTSASSNAAAAAAATTASSNSGRGGVEKSRSNKIGGRGGGGGGGAGVSERYSNSNDRYENTHAESKYRYAAGREFVRGGSTRGGGVANPVSSSGRGARSGAAGGGGGRRSEMKKTHSTEDLKQQNVVEKLTSSSQSAAANAASSGSCGGGGVGGGNVNNNSSTVDEMTAVNCGRTAQGSIKNYDVGDGASVGGASGKDENISSNKRSSGSAAKESSLSSSSSSQLHKPRHYNHHYYRPGIKSGAAAATTAAAGGGGGGKMAPSNSSGVTGGGHFFSGGARSEKFSSNNNKVKIHAEVHNEEWETASEGSEATSATTTTTTTATTHYKKFGNYNNNNRNNKPGARKDNSSMPAKNSNNNYVGVVDDDNNNNISNL